MASVRELSELLTEKEVKAWRIADNHAIAMCGMFLFNEVVKWRRKEDLTGLTEYVIELAKTKVETARSETPLADVFLEQVEGIEEGAAVQLKGLLYVRLSRALKVIGWQPSTVRDLHRDLKECDRFQSQTRE